MAFAREAIPPLPVFVGSRHMEKVHEKQPPSATIGIGCVLALRKPPPWTDPQKVSKKCEKMRKKAHF
eukprot:3835669-Amphidinium_carterae.1